MKQLFTIIIMCLSFSASAQFKIGVTSGVNHSTGGNLNGNHAFNLKARTSFNLGLAFDINLTERLSLEPILLYSNKGWFLINNIPSFESPTFLKYLSTQFLGKVHIDENIKFIAGFETGYLLDATFENIPDFAIGEISNLDLGIIAGLAFTFFETISFHMKWNYGITEVIEVNPNYLYGGRTGTDSFKNHTIMAGLTVYPFRIHKH